MKHTTLTLLALGAILLPSCGALRAPNPIDAAIEADCVEEIRAQRVEQ